jgi:hypothetical protein
VAAPPTRFKKLPKFGYLKMRHASLFVHFARRWARSWIGFFSVLIGWIHPGSVNSKISSLRCRRNQPSNIITDSELLDLINQPTFIKIDLDHPQLYELDVNGDQMVSEMISRTDCTKSLIFVARRSMNASTSIPILFSSSKLEQAIFLECRIDDDHVAKISKAVANGCAKLKSLVLPKNIISCTGARHLVTGLHIHGGVQLLDISFNRCGDNGADYLAFMLSKSKALRVLRLRGNSIQSRGAIVIANALIKKQMDRTPQTFLAELDLAFNEIGDGGAEAFAALLRVNCTLRTLDISHNSITIAGTRFLSSAMEANRTLDSLLVRTVAQSHGEQLELTAMQLRHTCGPASKGYVQHKSSPLVEYSQCHMFHLLV